MKVKELLSVLKDADPEALVILSSDAEGNQYHEAYSFSHLYNFAPGHDYIGLRKLTKELQIQGYGEEDVLLDGVPCVVLWP